jgi:DnaK suppressor protein
MYQATQTSTSHAAESRSEQFLSLLIAEKERLEAAVQRSLETLESLDAERAAVDDQVSLLHEQFVSIRQNNLAHRTLREIEASIARLKRGEYGACQGCDEPIAERRLRAIPWTRYCVGCQEEREDQERRALAA